MATARTVTDKHILRVRSMLAAGTQQNEICRDTGLGQTTVSMIARGLGRYSEGAIAERAAESRCLYGNNECGGPVTEGLCVVHGAREAARCPNR